MKGINRERQEELANTLTHGIGILFGIIAMPILISLAAVHGSGVKVIGTIVYGFSFLLVFTASTLYHLSENPETKRKFRILDHISIYFMIAGSYTPFIIAFLNNYEGMLFLVIQWSLVLFGILFKLFYTHRFQYLSLLIYVTMGWLILFAPAEFYAAIPTSCIVLMIVGGVLYTVGVLFFIWHKLKFSHAIWHVFVLAASICHYVAILLTVSA